jgi:hypothetical protein
MIQSFGDKASVLLGSNKIYSSTNSYWGRITSGAYFRFANDTCYFNVSRSEREIYSKAFSVKNKNTIILDSNLAPILMKGDRIKINYREYVLKQVRVIFCEGAGYKKDDLLFLEGGQLNPFYQSSVIFKVLSTDENGAIKEIEIIEKGKYIVSPEKNVPLNCSTDGAGKNAQIICDFDLNEKVEYLERIVSAVNYDTNSTYITFLQPLPNGINSGELSFEKWTIILTSTYNARAKPPIEEKYEIYNDFLPDSSLLKLIRGHTAPDVVINKNFELLLLRIKELESKIK